MTKNITIITLFVIIILLLKFCTGGPREVEVIKEVHDTAWRTEKKDTVYVPQPFAVYLPGKAPPAFEKWDTLYLPELVDTAAILQAYYSFNLYSDTIRNKYGYVSISDTISRNRILGRGATTYMRVPEITHTITLSQPRRNQVYIGAGLLGNEKEFVKGYEINLSLKTKQDHIIGLGYEQIYGTDHFYKLEYRRKISLKK